MAATRQDVMREMLDRGMPLTTETYTVWQEYRLGSNTRLRRAMDMLLGNGRSPDPVSLHRLYVQHCASRQEAAALQEVAGRALSTLELVSGLLGDMQGAAEGYGESLRAASADMAGGTDPLRPLMQRLVAETEEMIRHSETLVQRLNQSVERIDELEKFLVEARLEAATDKLTGLANRRAFDSRLMEEAAAAMNADYSLAVLLADVDHFKSVNDRYGHETGDRVLRMVAEAISQAVRGRDSAARYGGEEFAVILPDTSASGAVAVADNLRTAVSHCLMHIGAGEVDASVTISVGISLYNAGEKLTELLARADSALYQAKRDGRNRTVLAQDGS
jgi:diguanylate cyclase